MTREKLCPFRKQTQMTKYNLDGQGFPVSTEYEEIFLPCLGKDCASYWNDVTISSCGSQPREVDGCKLLLRGI